MKTLSTNEVSGKFAEIQRSFGNLRRLISDHKAAFISEAFKEFYDLKNVLHVLTTVGVARGNRQVERIIASIVQALKKLAMEHPEKWFRYVDQFARSTSIHLSVKTM